MWWLAIAGLGLVVGAFGAWSQDAMRVFTKTLGVPLALLIVRLAFSKVAPPGFGMIFIDLLIVETTAFCGDYVLGLMLGRHGRDGMREDSVGH